MSERLSMLLGIVVLTAFSTTAVPSQAGPLDNLFSRTRVEADPNKEYRLTEENGPWLVMACTFSGDGAYEQAHDLTLELRRDYKLPAYVYSKTFKHAVGDDGRGVGQLGESLPLKYRRGDQTNEVAVLVGDYPTIDDREAQKTLEKIKTASPKCLQLDPDRPTARNLAGWRLFVGMNHETVQTKGPMSKAFVVANPLVPKEYFAPKGLEKFVVDLNKDSPYSLLKCPGKYTVQVAHFTGRVVIEPKKVQAMLASKNSGDKLAEAGEKAAMLTKALRKKGFEAYEFHDRYSSIVTVGSFDRVGWPRPDGKIEIHPDILKIMNAFGAQGTGSLGQPQNAGAMNARAIVGIPLDIQPMPVEVPKASISASYGTPKFGWK